MFHNFTHDSSVVEFVLQKSFISFIKVFLAQNYEIFLKNTIMGLASIPYKYIASFSLNLIKNQFSCQDCVETENGAHGTQEKGCLLRKMGLLSSVDR